MCKKALSFLILLFISELVYAKSGLPIPRFASIKSNKVFARTGPGYDYPIQWIFTKSGEPVEIFAEFEQWRRIRDKYGDEGWVHQNMLSGKRYVVVTGDLLREMHKKNNIKSKVIAKLSPDLRCILKKSEERWCYLDCKGTKGWVLKEHLWGVYFKEKL
jgi:SH3-like domain-containing protein